MFPFMSNCSFFSAVRAPAAEETLLISILKTAGWNQETSAADKRFISRREVLQMHGRECREGEQSRLC